MKIAMKQLNNKDFSKVEQRILKIRRQLQEIQEQLRDCYHDQELYLQEKNAKQALEKWTLVEESILRQNSRV